nr:Fur family transcriptional regulator [Arcanobacterium phocisimile]
MQRMTKQREAIWELLRTENNFLSAQEVHDLLENSGESIGLATVYRNLQALATNGYVDVLRLENSETQLFRFCGEAVHHHHMVCRSCGKTIEISGANIEKWADGVAAEHGFTRVSHSFEIFGLCAECSANEA